MKETFELVKIPETSQENNSMIQKIRFFAKAVMSDGTIVLLPVAGILSTPEEKVERTDKELEEGEEEEESEESEEESEEEDEDEVIKKGFKNLKDSDSVPQKKRKFL